MAGLKLVFRHARADGSQSYVTVFYSGVGKEFYRIRDKTWTDHGQLIVSQEYATRQTSIDKPRVWHPPLTAKELNKIKTEQVKEEHR